VGEDAPAQTTDRPTAPGSDAPAVALEPYGLFLAPVLGGRSRGAALRLALGPCPADARGRATVLPPRRGLDDHARIERTRAVAGWRPGKELLVDTSRDPAGKTGLAETTEEPRPARGRP